MVLNHLSRRNNVRRYGFTLMEILVVMAIVLMLAGASAWGYMRYLEQAREDVTKMTIQHIAEAVEAYKVDTGDYPPDLATLTQPMGSKPAALEEKDLTDPWSQPYVYERENLHPQTFKCRISSTHPDSKTGQPISNW